MCCVLCFVLSPKQSSVLECHLSYISKNENYELCISAGFFNTTGKKDIVVCLVGARSSLRTEKKIQSSVWRVRNHYYNRKKKIQASVWRVHVLRYDRKKKYSRLSGGCAIIIMTGKKRYSHLSGGCAIIITTEKKKI